MTSLVNVINLSNEKPQKMSTSELQNLMEDIARKSDQPNVQINLLRIIMMADLKSTQIAESSAEQFFRKLA